MTVGPICHIAFTRHWFIPLQRGVNVSCGKHHVPDFLPCSPKCRMRLLELFDDPVSARDLEIELAAMFDAGKHFVSATYSLEGMAF